MGYSKYLCCFDLTIATRLIATIGLVSFLKFHQLPLIRFSLQIVSLILTVVTINDWSSMENFETTRKTASAFGLDWQHFHSDLSTAMDADPEGIEIAL